MMDDHAPRRRIFTPDERAILEPALLQFFLAPSRSSQRSRIVTRTHAMFPGSSNVTKRDIQIWFRNNKGRVRSFLPPKKPPDLPPSQDCHLDSALSLYHELQNEIKAGLRKNFSSPRKG
jgi:hypothetical protein